MFKAVKAFIGGYFGGSRPLVSVVRFDGVIASGGRFGSGLNIDGLAEVLERAFARSGLSAVALVINSPGGSPAQSSLIVKRLRALAEENGLPVFAFVEDVAASGGYMLACAADEIFADETSIIGSIGVVSAGFGFQGLIEKLGVERRVHTAGEHKAMLDPFKPEDPAEIAHLKSIQADIHQTFKDLVRTRRTGRLAAAEDEIFTGQFWTAGDAARFGLIDGIGDLRSVLRRRFGKKVRFQVIGQTRGLLQRLRLAGRQRQEWGSLGSSPEGIAAGFAAGALRAAEIRALWARFGL